MNSTINQSNHINGEKKHVTETVNYTSGFVIFHLALVLFGVVVVQQVSAATITKSVMATFSLHTAALKSDGTVWAWGINQYGELGDGTTTERHSPIKVSGLNGMVAIAGSEGHTMALKSDSTIWAWGKNSSGQLGDGTTTERHSPVQVSGLSSVVAIAGGGRSHSCALKSNGTVWMWGVNDYGQLGDGTTMPRQSPTLVSGINNVIAIGGGEGHILALKSDGTVWAWGMNDFGQLGDGTTTERHSPVQVSGLSSVVAIANMGLSSHSLALKSDGTVWAWGYNYNGSLGDGTTTERHSPVQVVGLNGIVAIAGGGGHSLALKSDGMVWAWGYNYGGALGDGTTINRYSPIQVSGLSSVIAIAGGGSQSLALKSDGTVWAWGKNAFGQLGDGTTTDRHTPTKIVGFIGPIFSSSPPPIDNTWRTAAANLLCSKSGKGSPIFVRSGDYQTDVTDAVLPSRGLPLQITRYFNSADSYDGPFSFGWCFNQTVQLMRMLSTNGQETAVVRWANGVRKDFTLTNGTYRAPVACYDNLSSNATGYILTMPKGMKLQFNSGGFLVWQEDRFGNRVTYDHDLQNRNSRVTSADGRTLDYFYGANNRVSKIRDWASRDWDYTYNTADDLVGVRFPDGSTMSYAYNTNHQLVAAYDARSNLISSLGYDASSGKATNYSEGAAVNFNMQYNPASNLTVKTDSQGRQSSFAYNSFGNKTNWLNPANNQIQISWTPNQQMNAVTDPRGYPQNFQYDNRGNVILASNSLGHVTRYTYETNFNLVTSIADPLGNIVTNSYDERGNLIRTADGFKPVFSAADNASEPAYGSTWTNGQNGGFGWGGGWQLASNGANGGCFLATTAGHWALESGTSAWGLWADGGTSVEAVRSLGGCLSTGVILRVGFENGYIQSGSTVGLSLRNESGQSLFEFYFVGGEYYYRINDSITGRVTTVPYASAGLTLDFVLISSNTYSIAVGSHVIAGTLAFQSNLCVSALRIWNNSAGPGENYNLYVTGIGLFTLDSGFVRTFAYDAYGNLTNAVDARGYSTAMTYDSHGNLLTTTDPLGNAVSYVYDNFGNRIRMTDARGKVWGYGYDIMGRLVAATNPLGQATSYSYDANGNQTVITDAKTNRTKFAYDSYNRPIAVTNAIGFAMRTEYDIYGNVQAVRDPLGNVVSNSYDILNQLAQTKDPLGNATSFDYDPNGNRTAVTDAMNNVTSYGFDPLNRMVAMTNALGGVWRYQFDANGNLLAVVDANAKTNRSSYDARNMATNSANALGYAYRYQYDGNGNVLQRTDPNGNVLAYSYDSANRLTNIAYPNGSVLTFTYDANGNTTILSNATETVKYAYDALNRVTNVFVVGLNKQVGYEYDAVGNRAAMVDPNGGRTVYAYDALNRMTGLADPKTNTWSFFYDAANRMTNMTMPNGIRGTYQYDQGSRLTNLVYRTSTNTILQSFAYTYDTAGNPLRVQREDNFYEVYQYDKTYQLTGVWYEATGSTGSGSTNWARYTYDLVGNRLKLQTQSQTNFYQYDAANRLLSVTSATSVVAMRWDNNGNLTNEVENGTNTWYSWDYENKMVTIRYQNGQTNTFSYYPSSSLRHTKVDSAGTNRYVYEGQNELQQLDGLGTLVAQYTYSLGIDSLLARSAGGNQQYYLRDLIGSVTAVADPAQNLLATYRYDAFGAVRRQTGSVNNPYLFTSRTLDQDSGLYYYRARYMDARNGGFTSLDPAGEGNGYGYVGGKPTMYIDPDGRVGTHAFAAGVGVVWGLVGSLVLHTGQLAGLWDDQQKNTYATMLWGTDAIALAVDPSLHGAAFFAGSTVGGTAADLLVGLGYGMGELSYNTGRALRIWYDGIPERQQQYEEFEKLFPPSLQRDMKMPMVMDGMGNTKWFLNCPQ